MKARMYVAEPLKVEVTATFTMPLECWKIIAEHMKDAPAYGHVGEFTSAIRSMSWKVSADVLPAPAGDE